jgi:hypothetical protein
MPKPEFKSSYRKEPPSTFDDDQLNPKHLSKVAVYSRLESENGKDNA